MPIAQRHVPLAQLRLSVVSLGIGARWIEMGTGWPVSDFKQTSQAMGAVVAALLATSTPAFGEQAMGLGRQNYLVAFNAQHTNFFFADPSTIKDRPGGLKSAWITNVYTPETAVAGAVRIVTLYHVDCSDDRFSSRSWVAYDKDGASIASGNVPQDWEYAVPGSTFDAVTGYVCGREVNSWPIEQGTDLNDFVTRFVVALDKAK